MVSGEEPAAYGHFGRRIAKCSASEEGQLPPFLRILYVFSVISFGAGIQSMKSAPILRCWKCSNLVFSAGGEVFFASAFLRQQAADDIELFQPVADCIFMLGELHRCLFEVGIMFDVAEQRFKEYGSVFCIVDVDRIKNSLTEPLKVSRMAKRHQRLIDADLIIAYDTLLTGASAVCSIVALQNRLTKFCDIIVRRADDRARSALSAAAEQIKYGGKEFFP